MSQFCYKIRFVLQSYCCFSSASPSGLNEWFVEIDKPFGECMVGTVLGMFEMHELVCQRCAHEHNVHQLPFLEELVDIVLHGSQSWMQGSSLDYSPCMDALCIPFKQLYALLTICILVTELAPHLVWQAWPSGKGCSRCRAGRSPGSACRGGA